MSISVDDIHVCVSCYDCRIPIDNGNILEACDKDSTLCFLCLKLRTHFKFNRFKYGNIILVITSLKKIQFTNRSKGDNIY